MRSATEYEMTAYSPTTERATASNAKMAISTIWNRRLATDVVKICSIVRTRATG